jgi:tRNA modification GTPase
MTEADVIAAIATASGRAAIGIVRLSGPRLSRFMQPLFGRPIAPRSAVLTDFLDSSGRPLDTGIALFFPCPRSYTGEDVLELQGHGGPAVLQVVLRRCVALGARLAQPGEFSKRAFLNGKLDLAQAESIADLIEASSEAAARAAMRSLKGEFSKEIAALVSELTTLRAQVEGSIDFPEEDTGIVQQDGRTAQDLRHLQNQLTAIQVRSASGRLLREGIQIVLIGPPNVGKSSLLNRLAGDEVAIVTEVPGTTRDIVRSEVLLDGMAIQLIDTAGLRETRDTVERLGIDRTRKAVQDADLLLLVDDAGRGDRVDEDWTLAEIPSNTKRIKILNKIDLVCRDPAKRERGGDMEVEVSAKTGAGLELLRSAILEAAGRLPETEGVFLARARHLDGLARAAAHLQNADSSLNQLDLAAEDLRLAQHALSEITGEFTADDLLGEIFSKFCIGK